MHPAPRRFVPLLLASCALAAAAGGPVFGQEGGAAPPAAPALPKPDGDAFVCIEDGALFLGDVETTKDTVKVLTSVGERKEWPRRDVSLAVAGGKVVHRGDESGLYLAWRSWLRTTHIEPLPQKKFTEADGAARDAWTADLVAAADRCAKRKMKYAAAALLGDAAAAGVWTQEMHERCIEWEPTEFPFTPSDEERSRLFADWSREIVPMGGRFVLKDEAGGSPTLPVTWTQDVVALRTRNLLIRSRTTDPALVGECLRQGEATVRALEHLLGVPDAFNDEPLEIRLYRDRKEYLEDTSGKRAMLWSAGYFSPGEAVSRFYVTRDEKTGKLEAFELYEVLSHELTHHWLERRRLRGSARFEHQPGYWIVEGFAKFVDSQAKGFQRGRFGFDDENGSTIRNAKMVRKANRLMPISKIVDLSQFEFASLPESQLGVFYEQGGALVFFLMNRKGAEGRKALLDYMERHYAGKFWDLPPPDPYGHKVVKPEDGKPIRQGWKVLGYDTPEALEREFLAFLDGKAPK